MYRRKSKVSFYESESTFDHCATLAPDRLFKTVRFADPWELGYWRLRPGQTVAVMFTVTDRPMYEEGIYV